MAMSPAPRFCGGKSVGQALRAGLDFALLTDAVLWESGLCTGQTATNRQNRHGGTVQRTPTSEKPSSEDSPGTSIFVQRDGCLVER